LKTTLTLDLKGRKIMNLNSVRFETYVAPTKKEKTSTTRERVYESFFKAFGIEENNSAFIQVDENDTIGKLRGRLRSAANGFVKNHKDYKFSILVETQQTENGKLHGIRVVRNKVEAPEETPAEVGAAATNN
jgi:hypothetical protein